MLICQSTSAVFSGTDLPRLPNWLYPMNCFGGTGAPERSSGRFAIARRTNSVGNSSPSLELPSRAMDAILADSHDVNPWSTSAHLASQRASEITWRDETKDCWRE